MKYRLGLDLGIGSVGSAVALLDNDGNVVNILDAGSRIFKSSEGAEARRLKRTARKNLTRTKKRLELLSKKLFENDLWVDDTPVGSRKLRAKSPYEIRYNAIYQKLDNPHLIGRALIHLAKHRGAGFVNAQEVEEEVLESEDECKKAKKLSPYEQILEHIKKYKAKTIGEFFYKRIHESYKEGGDKNLRTIRQKKYPLEAKIVDYAIPRYLVKDEFNQIWDKQAEFYPQMNKENLKNEVYKILFYERPPAPYATADCVYIDGEKRLSKAHPLSEMRRIYEEVNNIRIISDMGKRPLTLIERDKIIKELLLKGENAGKKSLKKLLNLSGQQSITLLDDRIIKAYLYSKSQFDLEFFRNLSDAELEDFIEFLSEPINPNDKNGRLYTEDQLTEQLKSILKIDDEKEIGSLLTLLPKSRGNLGRTASKLLLERMKASVITHREASDEIAKTDKRFMAEEEIARENQGKHQQLPYYGSILIKDTQPIHPWVIERTKPNKDEAAYGKIANPAVHMILNQLRLVVNDIIRIYGKPYEINLELGRDVGMSSKAKNDFEKKQKANEKLNDEAKRHLEDFKLYINKTNILKYKLAKEQSWKDAYNPTKAISPRFDGMEIEHIIPQAKGGTDTYSNLCLVSHVDNLAKGNDFAYEYFQKSKEEKEIRAILDAARKLPKNKSWRFEPDAREIFEDEGDDVETDRRLTDTRYVSKLAQRYLRAILDFEKQEDEDVLATRILSVKGSHTAKLRTIWNLDGIEYDLMGLNIPRYISCNPYWVEQNTGEVVEGINKPDIDGNWRFFDKAKNPEWDKKPRIDHRHHSMDAIIVACLNRSFIQKVSKADNRGYHLKNSEYPMPLTSTESVGQFRRDIVNLLKDIRVSHKPDHSKDGQFHEETGRTKLCTNTEDDGAIVTVYSRKILNVIKTKKDLDKLIISEKIKDEWHKNIAIDKKLQKELKENFEKHYDIAEQILNLRNEQGVNIGKKTIKISEQMIISETFKIIRDECLWKGDKFKCYENSRSLINIEKHGVAYKSGNNQCVDFYEKDGKIGWEVINRFNANQKDFVPEWKQNGGKIIWSIQQGDLLELDTPDEWKSYTDKDRCIAKVKKFSDAKLTIDYTTDARMTSPQHKNLKYMFVDSLSEKGLIFYTSKNARKIELTPFGKIKKKHKVLWNGKKQAA